MSIEIKNKECNCAFCGENYMTGDPNAWSPFVYCSGECEVLGEEEESYKDE